MQQSNSLPVSPAVDGFLRVNQIIGDPKRGIPGIIPISRSSWWQGVARGVYPQPVRHGRVTFWRISDIQALVERISAEGLAA